MVRNTSLSYGQLSHNTSLHTLLQRCHIVMSADSQYEVTRDVSLRSGCVLIVPAVYTVREVLDSIDLVAKATSCVSASFGGSRIRGTPKGLET
ncbi:hypothetical protein J6590_010616 [Homalodisca vitripennis]|nr:hypothetical protein J6590_010616 [Homalodisca vitripennis]